MSSSYHLDSPGFYHLTDFGYSWALFFLPVQTTGSHMHYLNFFADQPVYFFQNSLIYIRFFGICTFASITGHHCCQTGILGIFLKKGLPFHKSLQTSHPGTDIVGMKTGQSSDLCHFSHLLTLVPVYFIRTKYAFSPDCHRQLLIPPYKSVGSAPVSKLPQEYPPPPEHRLLKHKSGRSMQLQCSDHELQRSR